ncbi:hypothetical protein TNCV_1769211 [Trichonephila clavipes]|nr:hypothetical protein TNCV_1769211 [Trichonephila clavipes]
MDLVLLNLGQKRRQHLSWQSPLLTTSPTGGLDKFKVHQPPLQDEGLQWLQDSIPGHSIHELVTLINKLPRPRLKERDYFVVETCAEVCK